MSGPWALELQCRPVAKGRPRFGHGHAFTPERTAAYESTIAVAWLERHGRTRLSGSLGVRLDFTGDGSLGDLDNLAKSVLDGLNGIAWVDDRQVVDLVASRRRGPAGIAINVWRVTDAN